MATLIWIVGSCRWCKLTPPLSHLPLSRLCSSPLVCTESIRWCGYHLLPAQLLLVSSREWSQIGTTLNVDHANRMQVAHLHGHLFFCCFQRTDPCYHVWSMLPLRNVGLPLAMGTDELTSWPHGLWVLTPAMQNWILWSSKTYTCEPGVMGAFCRWACPGGSPIEPLKASWERSLCCLGLNKNELLLLTSPS